MWSLSLKEISQIHKKHFWLIIFTALALVFGFSHSMWSQNNELPPVDDDPLINLSSMFQGQWLPALDPLKIGKDNFKTLQNLRYTSNGLKGVDGYSAINTNIINASNYRIKNGFHFRKDQPAESHVLVQAENSGATASAIYENETAIPDTGNFTATALHTDSSGYGLGRFSPAPQGNVIYANGVESMIWGGDELRSAAFMTGTTTITNTITGVRDFSKEVQNTQTTNDQIAIIGGGDDSATVLLLHMDGADASTTFTDSSDSAHTPTAVGDAQMDTDQKKFGSASGLFNGTTDYVTYPDHANWFMGTGAFTTEAWVRFNDVNAYSGLFGQWVSDAERWDLLFAHITNELSFTVRTGGSYTVIAAGSFDPVVDTWYHIAIIRGWGGVANAWAITVNGTQVGSTVTDADPVPDYAAVFSVGASRVGQVTPYYLHGWLDEFRATKGTARWTSTFTPPSRAYQADSLYWVVGATRPLQGGKFYIQNANLTSGQTVTAKEWNGASWTDLTTTDNTSGLSATGTVTWSSTVTTSKPKYLEGLYLYFYQFALSDGEADIYYCTVDAPWQDIVDIWDGVLRQPIQFQSQQDNIYEDYTLEVSQPSSAEGEFSASVEGLDAIGDHILIQFEERMAAIRFQIVAGDNNIANVDSTLHYWDGEDWVATTAFSDLTSGGTETLNQTGVMAWSPPDIEQEFIREDFGSTGYSYKITFDGTLSGKLDSGTTDVHIDLVGGIPAQLTVAPFKFPSKYRDRVLLCGYPKAGEGNRVDYSLTNAPDVWNGFETSMGGLQSLYFGGDEELTCGTQIYNRFGANVFAMWVALKKNETYLLLGSTPDPESTDYFRIYPVSRNIGCPAPLTLDTAEVGYQVSTEVVRQVAIWLSSSGPVLFDGAVLMPLTGIENYFDRQNSECINFDSIAVSRGAYDQNNHEYNLLIPSGSSQTENNVWLVYDLIRKKWYKKDPGIGFEDSSSSLHTVTASGAFVDVTESMFGVGSGDFDGTDDYASIVDSSDWDSGTTDFSIDLWVKHSAVGVTDEYYVSQYEDGNNYWVFYLAGTVNNCPYFVVNSSGVTVTLGGGTAISDDNWHHLLLAKVGDEYGIYLDGTQTAFVDDADTDTFAGLLYIGQKGDGSWFNGHMDEVRIYHGNPFGAAPVVGLTDTITIPSTAHTSDSNTKLLLHMDNSAAIGMPQSLLSVTDTYGTSYLYGGLNTGYMMHVENGDTWNGTEIRQVVETGDFFPTEDIWYETLIRQVKLVAARISQGGASVSIDHYADTATSSSSLTAVDLTSGSARLVKDTQNTNILGWAHRLKFTSSRSGTTDPFEPIAWGIRGRSIRIEE